MRHLDVLWNEAATPLFNTSSHLSYPPPAVPTLPPTTFTPAVQQPIYLLVSRLPLKHTLCITPPAFPPPLGKPVDALARLVARGEVDSVGRNIIAKMREMMERQQFDVVLQVLGRWGVAVSVFVCVWGGMLLRMCYCLCGCICCKRGM